MERLSYYWWHSPSPASPRQGIDARVEPLPPFRERIESTKKIGDEHAAEHEAGGEGKLFLKLSCENSIVHVKILVYVMLNINFVG